MENERRGGGGGGARLVRDERAERGRGREERAVDDEHVDVLRRDVVLREHLLRDVGALNLALAVVLIFAFVRLSPDLVRLAAGASLAWNVPHLIYHVFNTDGLDTLDIILNIGGLSLSALYPVVLLYVAPKLNDAAPTPGAVAS